MDCNIILNLKPCPFCGQDKFPNGLTYGHKDGCFFDLLGKRDISEFELMLAWNGQVIPPFTEKESNNV